MDQKAFFNEVEDIMCDQGIISKELNAIDGKTSYIVLSPTRLRLAITVLARTVMPTALRIYYIYLNNQQFILDNVRHNFLPAVIAFIVNSISCSLASVQRKIIHPLRLRAAIRNVPEQQEQKIEDLIDDPYPEKSVDCQVLYDPSGEILADVVFIHGLHGGIDRTWKQGQWRHDGHKLQHQSPVRSQSTGDLYVPPRKQSLKRTLSHIYSKAPLKIARKDEESCVNRCGGEWEIVESDEVEDDEFGYSNCWPQDWLPKDCPGVRVIALNYTTDILWCPVWKKKRIRTDMVQRSDEMIDELVQLGVGKKPIIWVGHSKGGLFIKQILLNVRERHRDQPKICDVFTNSRGIMFYSVPHKGSYLADVTLPLLRRSVELVEIQRNCNFVLDQHKRFLEICENGDFKAEIFSFIETSFTFMSFMYLKIVAYESANPDVGVKCDVPLDHREICKPAGRDCFLYLELVKLIRRAYGST